MDPIFILMVVMAFITATILIISYFTAKYISKCPMIFSISYIIIFSSLSYWYSTQYNSLVRTVIIQKSPVENMNMNFNNSSVIGDFGLGIYRYGNVRTKESFLFKICLEKKKGYSYYRDVCLGRNTSKYVPFYVSSDEISRYLGSDAIIKVPHAKFYNLFLVILMSFGFSYFLSSFIECICHKFPIFKVKDGRIYFCVNFICLFVFILINILFTNSSISSFSEVYDKYSDVYSMIAGGILMMIMKNIYDSALFLSSDKILITVLGKLEEDCERLIKITKQIDYIEYWNFKNPQNKLNEHIVLYREKKKIKSKIENSRLFILKFTKNIGYEIDCNTLLVTKKIFFKLNKILKNNSNDN
ncbi:TPA: hypothetical protein U2I61_002016 [Providencia rettgeri]|nr:hypothetical protein [Providencia rettgeri]